jgi:hypothetical protein
MIAPHLGGSAVFRVLDRVVIGLHRAAGSSQVLGRLHPLLRLWSGVTPAERRVAGGMILLSAVAAHLALMALNPAPPGWFWLILPGIAVAIGVTLVASARQPRSRHRR